jgi:hypothetical protein
MSDEASAADAPVIPTADAWDRTSKAVLDYERRGKKEQGLNRGIWDPGDNEFFAKITDVQAISGGGSGGYKYEWTELIRTEFGFSDHPGRKGEFDKDTWALSRYPSAPAIAIGSNVVLRVSGRDDGVEGVTIVDVPGDSWGKVSGYAPGSNTVTLTPCSEDGTVTGSLPDVTVSITLPASRTTCSIVDINTGDVLAYRTTGTTSYLTSVPLPISTTLYDGLYIQGGTGLAGFNGIQLKA